MTGDRRPTPIQRAALRAIQAGLSVASHGDVIVLRNSEPARDLDNAFRYLEVRTRWRRVFSEMIMHDAIRPLGY
jgi:hypothetical protein